MSDRTTIKSNTKHNAWKFNKKLIQMTVASFTLFIVSLYHHPKFRKYMQHTTDWKFMSVTYKDN